MIRFLAFFILVFGLYSQVRAQELYMGTEFKTAYQKGTRNKNGTVSDKYRQNKASYVIKASVDPASKLLKGEAKITYTNNREDTLRNLVFHTYHDYYLKDSERGTFFQSGKKPETDGMVIEKCLIDNEAKDLKNDKSVTWGGTYYSIRLSKPLAPKSSITLEFVWHYTIPGEGFERSGAIDPNSMFIAYWYPEIAVVDDIDGWDRIRYNAETEFYHDYSDYEVEVTAPADYLVWASVAPNNASEVYPKEVLDRLEKAKKSENGVSIVSDEELKKGFKVKSNVWKYSAKNFPDFSFALSNHFVWEARGYKDNFGEYFLNSAYPVEHKEFSMVLKAEAESIKKFHTEFPIYEFPYHYFTVFNGLQGGGMEFPGMANDESISADLYAQYIGRRPSDEEVYNFTLGLTIHEMGHMYFPFLMGIHEKKYAWMDEGMASYTENFIPADMFSNDEDAPYMGNGRVLPMMTPTFMQKNSGINSYTMGSASYYSLSKLLGKPLFDKCLKAYMDRWNHKHPTPYDFFFTFNDVSGMNLNWFWKAWYFDWAYPDIAIEDYKDNVLKIKNEGGRPLAFSIESTTKDGKTNKEDISPLVWKDKNVYEHKLTGDIQSIKISSKTEAYTSNNVWPKK